MTVYRIHIVIATCICVPYIYQTRVNPFRKRFLLDIIVALICSICMYECYNQKKTIMYENIIIFYQYPC